jgi:hypothetical protein
MHDALVALPVRCTQTGAERKSLPAAGRPPLRGYRLPITSYQHPVSILVKLFPTIRDYKINFRYSQVYNPRYPDKELFINYFVK